MKVRWLVQDRLRRHRPDQAPRLAEVQVQLGGDAPLPGFLVIREEDVPWPGEDGKAQSDRFQAERPGRPEPKPGKTEDPGSSNRSGGKTEAA